MNPPTILVVDDNEDTTRITRSILEAHGYGVSVAHGGPEALAEVERNRPDLILLDIMMPEMSGMEVLERLRSDQKTAGIGVIMVTAKAEDDDVLAGYRYGADYYITKPFTAKQLLYGINLVLGDRAGAQAKD